MAWRTYLAWRYRPSFEWLSRPYPRAVVFLDPPEWTNKVHELAMVWEIPSYDLTLQDFNPGRQLLDERMMHWGQERLWLHPEQYQDWLQAGNDKLNRLALYSPWSR